MHKRGQTLMISALFSLFIFLFGIVFINFIMPEVTLARTSLTCSDSSNISDGTKATCLLVDIVVPYFIITLVSLSGGVLLNRILV